MGERVAKEKEKWRYCGGICDVNNVCCWRDINFEGEDDIKDGQMDSCVLYE